jgi:hypothetical protein
LAVCLLDVDNTLIDSAAIVDDFRRRQGRHAHDPRYVDPCPRPDLTVSRIGDLLEDPNRRELDRIL